MKRAHITVSGLVQGVGFRSYTRNYAKDLGLVGFVKNLNNGNVQIVVEGYDKQMQTFFQLLRKGPQGAKVSDLDVDWQDPTNEFSAFEVR